MSAEATAAASLPLSAVQADPSALMAILDDLGFAIVEGVCRQVRACPAAAARKGA